jgi:hypothetical protein
MSTSAERRSAGQRYAGFGTAQATGIEVINTGHSVQARARLPLRWE